MALLLLITALPAVACRYSVREVGFVNLDDAPYRFLIYRGDSSDEVVARLKRAAYAAFVDTDIEIQEATPGESHVDYRARHAIASYPAGILVAPEGQSLPMQFTDAELADDDAMLAQLRTLVSSPLRDALREQVVEPFCTVLLVHGDDAKLDVSTKNRVEAAIDELTRKMDQLEKATKVPPHLLELTADQRNRETALLWSLGLSPADLTQPRVAMLFGRARRMGSVLRGDRVTQDSLVEIMSLIGASCECGLDRKWMQGPMLLMEWDSLDQDRLAKHLGFDPESPMVKTEISQIIAQGKAQGVTAMAQSVMGMFEPAGKGSAAGIEMEDVLAAEDVPPGAPDGLIVEDVPLEEGVDGVHVSTSEASRVRDDDTIRVFLSTTFTPTSESSGTVDITYLEFGRGHWAYVILPALIIANVAMAFYLYRKRSRQDS